MFHVVSASRNRLCRSSICVRTWEDACQALGHELLPKSLEGTRVKMKRLVELGVLTEADTGNFARKPQPDTYFQESPAKTRRAYWSSGPMSATTV
ncbi:MULTISPECIES: hypothetical protein [unclassified Streptomyces]